MHNNKQRSNTNQKIEHSLIKILQETELRNVTVTQICSLAKINRSTFYNHYKSIDDVFMDLQLHYKQVIVDFLKTIQQLPDYKSNYPHYVRSFLQYVMDNKEIFKALLNADGTLIFVTHALEITEELDFFSHNPSMQKYVVAGNTILLQDLVFNENHDSIENMSLTISRILELNRENF